MKRSYLRPLAVMVAIVGLVLIARLFVVPRDFRVSDLGFRFGWHRIGNEQEWKNFAIKYQGTDYCAGCHEEKVANIKASFHKNIQCENCHGPALDHPSQPPKLPIDTSRAQCLRCHLPLAYPASGRATISSVDPATHNPDIDCSACHDPHHPNLEGRK